VARSSGTAPRFAEEDGVIVVHILWGSDRDPFAKDKLFWIFYISTGSRIACMSRVDRRAYEG
jgi:hypothetical protein